MPSMLRRALRAAIFTPMQLAGEMHRGAMSRIRRGMLGQRERAIRTFGEAFEPMQKRGRVLAVMTHVVTPAALADPARRAEKLGCFSRAIEQIFVSLAHHQLDLVVNTYRDMSLVDELPEEQRSRLTTYVHGGGDPMFIEFYSQELFLQRRREFDWFLFIEDDLLLYDPCFIEKIEEFNRWAPVRDAVLIPHLYEVNSGTKYYISRDFRNRMWKSRYGEDDAHDVVSRLTVFEIDSAYGGTGIRFAEFTNPHGACHCLSREQLERWARTGRRWYGRVSWIGSLESAATGALFERFALYRPHPENKWYLELRHFGTKYSDRIRQHARS
jgi:hypothetical protein